jgi:hypothetical protein
VDKFLIIVFLGLIGCKSGIKKENIVNTPGRNSYFLSLNDPETQDCAEYLGSMEINSKRYEVINFFRRVMAAENWHVQSRLIFLSEDDTLTYMLSSNSDFPSSIDSNKLYFPQKQESRKIDSLTDIICLPTGCVNKEDNLSDMFFLKPDSVAKVFRGGYFPF